MVWYMGGPHVGAFASFRSNEFWFGADEDAEGYDGVVGGGSELVGDSSVALVQFDPVVYDDFAGDLVDLREDDAGDEFGCIFWVGEWFVDVVCWVSHICLTCRVCKSRGAGVNEGPVEDSLGALAARLDQIDHCGVGGDFGEVDLRGVGQ